MTRVRDYYRILGVPQSADAGEIRRAYRTLARRFHPDATGHTDGDAFRALKEAYDTLSDSDRRARYDLRSRRAAPPPARQPLAQDVAIDFPAVEELLGRVRDAFLGPDGDVAPMTAELRLTRREARTGVSVPLEVPLLRTCQACGGRGEVWMERCHGCDGAGESPGTHPVELSVPAGIQHGTRFRLSITVPDARPTIVDFRIRVQ